MPWAHWWNKLHSTICIVLLSEFVSRKRGYNTVEMKRSEGIKYIIGVDLTECADVGGEGKGDI